MNLTDCLGATNQLCAVSQVSRKRFLDCFVVEERENGVDDFPHALGIEVTELTIDGDAPPDMDCSERRIRLVFF